MILLIILGVIYYCSYRIYHLYFLPSTNIDPTGKYVLISGCDTGVGHLLAVELDKQGFHVLAGIHNLDNFSALNDKLSPRATVFRLDITKQDEIDAVFQIICSKTNTLHALVNNAGIADGYLIDWTSVETIRRVMDVNYFGAVAMTKTCLPLLIAKRSSRVVNVSSISGYVSFAGTSAISASNHALEAFSDCLRREMRQWDLHVSIIEPGAMRTAFIDNLDHRIDNLWRQLSEVVHDRYGDIFFHNTILQVKNSSVIVGAENPYKAVLAIQHAISNSSPAIRYRPGWQSTLFFLLSYICSTQIMDFLLNLGEASIPAGVRHQLSE
ncbi:unnamed protein product [Adineta ricciae]|uniref:Uncharacterized protein n=1 Tax=Adineta ricciae TaxID=249248 RepID=A0A815L8J5_ADIRI|nr:unnamed protein product [Adineta ricciae]